MDSSRDFTDRSQVPAGLATFQFLHKKFSPWYLFTIFQFLGRGKKFWMGINSCVILHEDSNACGPESPRGCSSRGTKLLRHFHADISEFSRYRHPRQLRFRFLRRNGLKISSLRSSRYFFNRLIIIIFDLTCAK